MNYLYLCDDCGESIMRKDTRHSKTNRCIRLQKINESFQFKCRKCGELIEKLGEASYHTCSGFKEEEVMEEKEETVLDQDEVTTLANLLAKILTKLK